MLMVCLLFPVLGWVVWSANAASLVEDELAKIRGANEPIEPQELDAFYAIRPGRADATQLWVDVTKTFESNSYSEDARDLPIVGDGPEIPPVGEKWEQLEAVEAYLRQYKDEMTKIHAAAALGGDARFDRDFEQGFAMLLPRIQGLRAAARMLVLEARVAARRGDAKAVARSIHAIFAVSRAAEEDPLFVSSLVRLALVGEAINELEIAIGSIHLSDDDLKMLQQDIRSVDLHRGLERSLMGERVMGLMIFRDPSKFYDSDRLPLSARANNEDRALYLTTFAKYIRAAREPFPRAMAFSQEATWEMAEVVGDSRVNKIRYRFTDLLITSVDSVFEATARVRGANACADTSIAIEQFRRANGSLPLTLAELVPEFLPAVPIDSMDGNPLRYVVNDDGYMLYSVGRNGVDDGGVIGDERLDEVFSVKVRATNPPAEAVK